MAADGLNTVGAIDCTAAGDCICFAVWAGACTSLPVLPLLRPKPRAPKSRRARDGLAPGLLPEVLLLAAGLPGWLPKLHEKLPVCVCGCTRRPWNAAVILRHIDGLLLPTCLFPSG